jgi:acetolactate synthase-1/2/3 large subunit
MKIRVADYIFKYLADRGARHVFMVTGGGAMFLNDAVRVEKRLTPIFNQHEQACAMAAEGYVRAGNGIGVVSVTSGPGGTNTLTGVIGSWLDSIPVIFISGQVKFSTTIMSCPKLGLRQLGDQEINIVDIVHPITKYASTVLVASDIKNELEKAFTLAYAGRPGPVWLDIPLNVQNAQIDEDALVTDAPPPSPSAEPDSSQIQLTIEMLRAARRPALIAGHGIRLAGAEDMVCALAEELGIPVLTTFNGFDLIPSDHPLFGGRIGTLGNRSGNFILQSADLLLSVGSRNNIRQVSYNWENFGKQAKKIVVDIDAAELKKPTIKVDLPIRSDAKLFFMALRRALQINPIRVPKGWLAWCQARRKRFALTPEDASTKQGAVDAYYFMETLTTTTPADVVVVAGNGTACVSLFQSGRIKPGQRIFWNSGCASMGYDLPAALGSAVSGRKTVCIAGDGSIQMNLAELQTVLNYRLPIKLFLLENNGYSSIRQTQNSFFHGLRIGCDTGSGLILPNMLKLARCYGFRTSEIRDHKGMKRKINSVLTGDDPAFCVVRLGENTFAPKLSSRTLADGSIASSSLEDMAPFLPEDVIRENLLSD